MTWDSGAAQHVSVHQPVLGTVLELRLGAPADVAAAAEARVLAVFDELEGRFSVHRPDSELCRWRSGAIASPGADLTEVLALAAHWFAVGGGAFHPATAAVSARWRAAAADGAEPSEAELARLAATLRVLPFEIVDGEVRRTGDTSHVDLNAIAKGWIVDRAVHAALSSSVSSLSSLSSVVVNAGGDLVHAGDGSIGVAIEDPRRPFDNAPPLDRIVLDNAAIATSGTSRRGIRIGGRWYGHVIDPRTARPTTVAGSVRSASVIAADAATADVVATVVGVLSPAEGLEFVAGLDGVACCLVTDDGSVVTDPRWDARRA